MVGTHGNATDYEGFSIGVISRLAAASQKTRGVCGF